MIRKGSIFLLDGHCVCKTNNCGSASTMARHLAKLVLLMTYHVSLTAPSINVVKPLISEEGNKASKRDISWSICSKSCGNQT